MAVNETLLGSTMTNFTLPSPKRHRKYEETGTIHDEVIIHYSVVYLAQRMTFGKRSPSNVILVHFPPGCLALFFLTTVKNSFTKWFN